ERGGFLREPDKGIYSTQVIPQPPLGPTRRIAATTFNGINDGGLIVGSFAYANNQGKPDMHWHGILLWPNDNLNDVSTYARSAFSVDAAHSEPFGLNTGFPALGTAPGGPVDNWISGYIVGWAGNPTAHGFIMPLSNIPPDRNVKPTTPGVV